MAQSYRRQRNLHNFCREHLQQCAPITWVALASKLGFGRARSRPCFDVLDEGAKLRHDLMASWMKQKHTRSEWRKGFENAQKLTFRNGSRHDWFGQLCQP